MSTCFVLIAFEGSSFENEERLTWKSHIN